MTRALATAALGPEFDYDVVRSTLRTSGVAFREEDDIAAAVADLLVDGKVVAWFQGPRGDRTEGARPTVDPRVPAHPAHARAGEHHQEP